MRKLLYVINDLKIGGAELMVFRLTKELASILEVRVIALGEGGEVQNMLALNGIEVTCLNISPNIWGLLQGFVKLRSLIRSMRPDVIQGWMYHANFLVALIKLLGGHSYRIFWGIRQTNLSKHLNKRSTLIVAKLCGIMSRFIPEKIIYCSVESKESHEEIGYEKSRGIVIENGYSVDIDERRDFFRASFNKDYSIRLSDVVVGTAGRFDVQKGQEIFVRAAKIISQKIPNIKFAMCGSGISWKNEILKEWIVNSGLTDKFVLLDLLTDMSFFYQSIDVFVSPSLGESFPNAIAEAMLNGVPCVATDVGASAKIVGETGYVVQPGSISSLAFYVMKLIGQLPKSRISLRVRARSRIVENFGIDVVIKKYLDVYGLGKPI